MEVSAGAAAHTEVPGGAHRHQGHRVPSHHDVSAPKDPSGSPGPALRDGFGAVALLPQARGAALERVLCSLPSSQNRAMIWVGCNLEGHPV